MKDKNLIIKQGRQYFSKGGLDGVYKKLYAYEQIADKPEKVIAIKKVFEIIDEEIASWERIRDELGCKPEEDNAEAALAIARSRISELM